MLQLEVKKLVELEEPKELLTFQENNNLLEAATLKKKNKHGRKPTKPKAVDLTQKEQENI